LADRSRRPKVSPGRIGAEIESAVLALRDEHNWGARKIRRVLGNRGVAVPSARTVTAVLQRHDRIQTPERRAEGPASGHFEYARPNQLWQFDHKGPVEIARQKHYPLTVLDDHSRFCLCFEPLINVTLAAAWPVLWGLFGEYGMPEAMLSDRAFAADRGVSDLDQRLIRLGIKPIHGRGYHPQTQGKVERLHGTLERELLGFKARTESLEHFRADRDKWRQTYNLLRPHESLGDQPPISRYRRSTIPRPATLPDIEYAAGAELRRVSQVGDIHYRKVRITVGRALARQYVRIEERDAEVAVYYSWKLVRVIQHDRLVGRGFNQIT
jgi:transposase InsO family protein